jgi:glycosyltransferase involved in cell wall biosynthesis
MKITLISRDNGVGLSTDIELLGTLFSNAGHQVMTAEWKARKIPQTDVAIFIELLSPHLMRFADKTIGIFNPEWFLEHWTKYAGKMNQIWAKSTMAAEVFEQLNRNTHYTGFLTRDLYDPDVPRQDTVIHVQGNSQDKNTARVLETWSAYGDELPPLTVLTQKTLNVPKGVTRVGRVDSTELRRMMNENFIHLCPSRVEGWGHYITEALSVGAHVVTTDASPMNEHVSPGWGTLIPYTDLKPRGITFDCDVSPDDIASAVQGALKIPAKKRAQASRVARSHTEQRNKDFSHIALKLLES